MTERISYWKELPDSIKEEAPNNGNGKEWANYLIFDHSNKIFAWASDAMEPEDAKFTRDLSWIGPLVEKAYQQGLKDAKESIGE